MRNFNRNVITESDLVNFRAGRIPKSFDTRLPAGASIGQRAAVGPGGVAVPSADDYLTILLKYIPIEIVGAYLFMQSLITGNVIGKHDLAVWLGSLLGGFILLVLAYDWRVLMIVRFTQYVMSAIGLAVYVFAFGGWFATTTWYHGWYAGIALPLFALLVAIIPVPSLPVIAPQVNSVAPPSGPVAGGTQVTITGRGFVGVSAVQFNGTAAANFAAVDDYTITAISPAAGAGQVDVVVTTPGGKSSTGTSDLFTYQ